MANMTRAPAVRARQRGFFDFSMSELAIIFGLALMVLGPKKLPGLVQQIGRWVGRARHMARQFREQLEQEVNAVNAVKPVPRNVAPDVGPPAPSPEAAAPGTEATGVVDPGTAEGTVTAAGAEPAPVPEPPGSELHPEAQIYFALNGTQPEVVAQDPYASQPVADDPQAAEHPDAPPAAKSEQSNEPASVEVVFPHDHG
jgi:Tat protein translocase TatB subunit